MYPPSFFFVLFFFFFNNSYHPFDVVNIFKKKGLNCNTFNFPSNNKPRIFFSFSSLSSLHSAHLYATELGYKSFIYRDSVFKTFPYDPALISLYVFELYYF